MSVIRPPSRVLVTGASGYIGAWIVKHLVERGYNVLAALRTEAAGNFLVNRFPSYQGKVSYTIVPDIEKEGAYDDAVKQADAIIHTASPVTFDWEDPTEILGPAVNGALGILRSAAAFGPNVKRVVLTSSTAALASGMSRSPATYDESSWNGSAPAHVRRNGKSSNRWLVYAASKVSAETAAWDWTEKHKPSFKLTTILPTVNLGPWLHDVSSVGKITSTLGVFTSGLGYADTSGRSQGTWVDARDAALLHVLALETEAAADQRIIASAGVYAWQDVYDALNDAGFPHIPGKTTRGAGRGKDTTAAYSNAKSLRIFPDFQYRTLEETSKDTAIDLQRIGFFGR